MSKSFGGRGERQFLLGVSLLALAATAQSASAQSCPGDADQPCEISVTADDEDVSTSGDTHIVNEGSGTTIVQTNPDHLFIENRANALIDSISFLPAPASAAPVPFDTVVINAGTIEGDLTFVNGGIYVNDGGTVTGNLTSLNGDAAFGTPQFASGNKTGIFVNRAAAGSTGIEGVLDPGNGLDVYVQSFAASETHVLPASLPTHFELGGVEALGADTTVTIAANPAQPIARGLAVMGDGRIVNTAEIDPMSLSGIGVPDQFIANIPTAAVVYYGVPGESRVHSIPVINPTNGAQGTANLIYGSALSSFANEGVINGDLIIATASFVNDGELNLLSNGPGTLIGAAADRDFSFVNNGTIEMAFNGLRQTSLTQASITIASALDTGELKAVSIVNAVDAELEGGLAFTGAASDFVFANSGSISMGINPNGIDRAVDLEIGGMDFALDPAFRDEAPADSVTITNAATGQLEGGMEISAQAKTFAFTNDGLIAQDADDEEAEALEIYLDD